MNDTNKCWRCNQDRQDDWTYCPKCSARLRDNRTLSTPQPERDMLFILDLYSFGWYNRDVAAIALYEGIVNVSAYYDTSRLEEDIPLVELDRSQQILRTKIFAEFISLLEAFGVLCLSIRSRKKQSILSAYLKTEPQEVAQFYQQILSSPKISLTRLLNLPSISQIKKAFAEKPQNLSINLQEALDNYQRITDNMRIIAELYRNNSSANVRIYNKIKHVFPIIEGVAWVQPPISSDKIAILMDDTGLTGRLSMSQEDVDLEMANIRRVTLLGSELMAMCLWLQRLGILF
jgi:hypothetical protein